MVSYLVSSHVAVWVNRTSQRSGDVTVQQQCVDAAALSVTG